MAWLALVGWLAFLTTAGVWGWRVYTWRPRPAPVTPLIDDWHVVLRNRVGDVESIRRAKDGQFTTRIHRGHGHESELWYRLTAVEGLALIYTPEP